MEREKFEPLVAKPEKKAKQDPCGYPLKVLLWAVLDNAYVFAILLFLAALLPALPASVICAQVPLPKFHKRSEKRLVSPVQPSSSVWKEKTIALAGNSE